MTIEVIDGKHAATSAVEARAIPSSRLLYIDNLRIFLTVLVILHHLMVIYAGSGSWIYNEGREDEITNALGGWFCAANQAYFMGLFLLISAYFVPGSYDRKGPAKFLLDRLFRLGIPLVVYGWVLRPLFIYYGMHLGSGLSFWSWYSSRYFQVYGVIGGGPLWFIETLLIFSLLYVLGRKLIPSRPAPLGHEMRFPGNRAILLFGVFLGAASFLVRLFSPVNNTFAPLNLQFANFAQYIALFILGLIAYRRNWIATLPEQVGGRWLRIAILLILLYAPLGLLTGANKNEELFLGGWHWQAMLLAQWEAFVCLSMSIGLIWLFRRRLNKQGMVTQELSRGAYSAYLIHELVITSLALLAVSLMAAPLLKFILMALVSIPLCFALSSLIRRLPYMQRIL